MSITSRISSMEEHVTNAYNGLQGLGADLTNVDKNIDNIAQVLDDIYDDLPKVTGSGTSITLEDTRKGRIESTLSGNTSQFTTTGKNLFNIEGRYETGTGIEYTKNSDGSYTLNGTANGNNFLRGLCYLNEQHTLSYTSNVSNSNVILRTRTGTPSAQTGIQDQLAVSSTSGNLTSSKQFDFVEISIVSGTTLNNFKIYIQLEKGSSVTSFEPYTGGQASPNPDYPQEVHIVRGDNKINITGRNLLEGIEYGEINSNSGVESDSTGTIRGTNYIPYDTSSTYYVSVNSVLASVGINLRFYNKNKEYLGWSTLTGSGKNLYVNIGTQVTATDLTPKYFKFRQTLSAGPITSLDDKVMITKINNMNYEPYSSNSYPINLGMKNLWNSEDMKSGYLPQSGSYPTTDPSYPNSRYIIVPLMKGQSITTYSEVTYSAFRIRYIDKDTNLIVGTVSVGENNGYCNSNATYQSGFANGTITATKDVLLGLWDFDGYMSTSGYYKITYGTTLQQISPNPIELAEISTYNNEIFRTSGKNLYDGLYTAKRYINYNTGEMRTSDDWSATDYIEIEPNTSYTLSGITNSGWTAGTSFYDNSKAFISSVYSTAYTFTTPTNAKYLRLSLNSETPINIMLNEGSTALPYEPYGTGEWYYKEAISQKILNGSENWGKSSKTQVNRYFVANVFVTILSASSIDLISNYFVCITPNQSDSNNIGLAKYNENGLMVNFSLTDTNFDTLEKFKTWLTSNNVLVRYVLATPTYNKITYEPLLEQLEAIYNAQGYDNQTNISQTNNDLPFIISASALKEWSE